MIIHVLKYHIIFPCISFALPLIGGMLGFKTVIYLINPPMEYIYIYVFPFGLIGMLYGIIMGIRYKKKLK